MDVILHCLLAACAGLSHIELVGKEGAAVLNDRAMALTDAS